jgi:hypothetical protein
MGDRSLDDFLDGDDDGDDSEESPDRSEEAVDDPVDSGGDDREEVEASDEADDESDGGAERERGETTETDTSAGGGEPDEGPRVDPTTVEPAEATYAWSGDGDACAACGETVERRWHSEDGLVCPDCKEW